MQASLNAREDRRLQLLCILIRTRQNDAAAGAAHCLDCRYRHEIRVGDWRWIGAGGGIETGDCAARFQQGEEHGLVGLNAGMRLDINAGRAEEFAQSMTARSTASKNRPPLCNRRRDSPAETVD